MDYLALQVTVALSDSKYNGNMSIDVALAVQTCPSEPTPTAPVATVHNVSLNFTNGVGTYIWRVPYQLWQATAGLSGTVSSYSSIWQCAVN
jgi:hypothetical protein